MTIELTEEGICAIKANLSELTVLETFARCNCNSELSNDLIFMDINRIREIFYNALTDENA